MNPVIFQVLILSVTICTAIYLVLLLFVPVIPVISRVPNPSLALLNCIGHLVWFKLLSLRHPGHIDLHLPLLNNNRQVIKRPGCRGA